MDNGRIVLFRKRSEKVVQLAPDSNESHHMAIFLRWTTLTLSGPTSEDDFMRLIELKQTISLREYQAEFECIFNKIIDVPQDNADECIHWRPRK